MFDPMSDKMIDASKIDLDIFTEAEQEKVLELCNGIKNDNVNHPSHYETGKYQCIDVMEETQGKEAVKDFVAVIPGRTLNEINKILLDSFDIVKIGVNSVLYSLDTSTLASSPVKIAIERNSNRVTISVNDEAVKTGNCKTTASPNNLVFGTGKFELNYIKYYEY